MSEVIHLKGQGGAVWEMTLPLHPDMAKRYEAGELARVNPDGSPYSEDAPKPRSRRSKAGPAEDPAGD